MAFADTVKFTAGSSGTSDFSDGTALTGFRSLSTGAVSGQTYSYRAFSADLSQWENGQGTYTSGSPGTLARTTQYETSTGSKVSFSSAPVVILTPLKADMDGLLPATTSAQGIVQQAYSSFYNLGLAASVGSSALTIAVKGVDGNDPSATNPVIIPFRNVTAATGTPSYLTLTAALSLVISSGSTLGMTSAVATTLAIVLFNDAGTARIGLINPLQLPLADGIASSTAEGGAGAADSAGVFYTGTAVTSKAYTVIGYAVATEATAGTWATAPATLKVTSDAGLDNVLPLVTRWVAYTPTFTGFGTPTNVNVQSCRVGSSLRVRGSFNSGTPTATEARMSIGYGGTDGNVTSDATFVAATQIAGPVGRDIASGPVLYLALIETSKAYVVFGISAASTSVFTKLLGTGFVSAGDKLSFQLDIPISGW